MAATYNWSYKPGVANKYGINIDVSADDVKPANACYVAHWGNDTTGNGSRMKPYRTIEPITSPTILIFGSGVYRFPIQKEFPITAVVGDGNTVFDLTNYLNGTRLMYATGFYNLTILGNGNTYMLSDNLAFMPAYMPLVDCKLKGIKISSWLIGSSIKNNLITNGYFALNFDNVSEFKNLTFDNVSVDVNNNVFTEVIFNNCHIEFTAFGRNIAIRNSIFNNCTFSVLGSPIASADINSINSSIISAIPSFITPIYNSNFANPAFNAPDLGDYTLSLDSPARNMSYFGTFIGAYSISKALGVKSNAALSAFDNSTAENLNIADNSLTLVDVNTNASIVTKPIDNTAGRELQKLHTFGINADRNGEYVDATPDLAPVTIGAGTTLTVSTPYLVETGSITYDGNVYNAGARFTSKSSSVGTFTTSTGGVLREILEAPARENVEARFSDGELTTVDNTATLEELAWYFVESNAITYNGDTYDVGTFVKVLTGVTSFTGSGVLRKVFSAADAFFYFEINQKPTSNNVGNSRTGAIVRGNGDKDFDRTAANVFPISKKFIQLKYTIQVNNLTP